MKIALEAIRSILERTSPSNGTVWAELLFIEGAGRRLEGLLRSIEAGDREEARGLVRELEEASATR